jgi:hypothetical protein
MPLTKGSGKQKRWFELNSTQLLYAGVNVLGGRIYTINKNTDTLVVASKEISREVNADETKYMFMSGDQNAERIHNIKDT